MGVYGHPGLYGHPLVLAKSYVCGFSNKRSVFSYNLFTWFTETKGKEMFNNI